MKKNTKKMVAFCCFLTFLFCSTISTLQPQAKTLNKYEVYNGFGELIYTANSLNEAEYYLSNLNGEERSVGTALKAARVVFSKGVAVIGAAYTMYTVYNMVMGKADVADVINTIVPVEELKELIAFGRTIFIYTYAKPSNPYPPHSFEGAMWARNNYYYIIG